MSRTFGPKNLDISTNRHYHNYILTMTHRVLIIGEQNRADELAALLKGAGYEDLWVALDGQEAARLARLKRPDVVLMDIDLPGGDSIVTAREILVERPVPIVMHASYSQLDRIREADEMGVSAHLFRPVTKDALLGAIELGVSRFQQCQALHAEIGDCKEALRVRKLVERAKGILMKRHNMSEEEAFLKLQRLSRNNNMPMEKVAESIITASEVL